jgi:predicted adenylyl cyclase CyaB
MPANLEVKARLRDPAAAHAAARRLCGREEVIRQTDVFFRCPQGRLKLRLLENGISELIFYQRSDEAQVRRSDYQIAPTSNGDAVRALLARCLGEIGTVKKVRSLYRYAHTRIHIDEVEDLGDFLEVEVVLQPGQCDADGRLVAEEVLRKLGIAESDYTSRAYVDLMRDEP